MGNNNSQDGETSTRKLHLKHIPGGSNARNNFVSMTDESQSMLEQAFSQL